ncbi:hypothetical protein C8R45DRAFT_837733 [Mycena sanguinolenta]|nr:hypothetical protein C8R45DRAFT_837733 [Mycena sanguinolenta]
MSGWMKSAQVMKEFVAALGGSVAYRLRSVTLIAEMVPVDMRIEDNGTWRMIESDSGLEEGSMAGGRWVKAVLRRSPGQRVAHLRVDFTTPEAANHAIDHGIYWQGRNIKVRKFDDEPPRCMKCQGFDGHFAGACKSTVDICGWCGEQHRTTECTVEVRKCANCGVAGQGAVDRDCPFFWKAVQDRRARDPTAGYRYFPTADPKTWAMSTSSSPVSGQRGDGSAPVWGDAGGRGRLAGGQRGHGSGAEDGVWEFRGRPQVTGANATQVGGLHQTLLADTFSRGNGLGRGGLSGQTQGRQGPSPLGRNVVNTNEGPAIPVGDVQ